MARPWRVAESLLQLRSQINERYPNRNKSADGTVGDAAHQSRTSDHNPHIVDGTHGVVSALDITHDPKGGCDAHAIAEWLRTQKDTRIKYVISNRRIFSSTTQAWTWRKYSGSNPHTSHFHVSVKATKGHYDSKAEWSWGPGGPQPVGRPILRRGASGDYVRELQELLGINIDGQFGALTENAVIDFQRQNRLTLDGIVGPATWEVLMQQRVPDPDSPAKRRTIKRGDQGDDVQTVQELLDVTRDGHFGPVTEAAVKAFQRGSDLKDDGIVGPLTWAVLDELENTFDGEPIE
jgi:peptidoglycan hydrolase-like protein with peptidoglycan-binding domain